MSFNHPELTSQTLDSVLTFYTQDKIILLHNGSLPQHIETLKTKYPEISHLILEKNRGFSGGANYLLDQALKNHEWVFFLTNDTHLLNPIVLPEKRGLYAPLIYRRKLDKIDSVGGVFNLRRGHLYHCKSKIEFEKVINDKKNHLLPYIPGTAFLIDRQTWNNFRPFDESLHTYWEDVDFSLRVFKGGGHLSSLDAIRLTHKVGKTTHKNPFYTSYLFHRNRKIITRRHSRGLKRMIAEFTFLKELSLKPLKLINRTRRK